MALHTHHPSDEALLRAVDREQSPRQLTMLDRHLASCEPCRVRRQELHEQAEEFFRACRLELAEQSPRADALRDRLRVSMASLSKDLNRTWRSRFVQRLATVSPAALAVAVMVTMAATAAVVRPRLNPLVSDDILIAGDVGVLPVRSLTPGATRPVRVGELCAGRESTERSIPAEVRQAVLRDYRMETVPAHEYELDYLITPELGGSADRLNLWPERYGAPVWNARVKDELEHLLPQLVCRGELDLATAQRDIAANWIAAYKKYFRTERPVAVHAGVLRDDDPAPTLVFARDVSLVARAGSAGPTGGHQE